MTLITRNHPALSIGELSVRITDTYLYFSVGAMKQFNLEPGKYVQFLNEDSKWNFYISEDPEGFKITKDGSKNGIKVSHSGLCRMMKKSIGKGFGDHTYYIQETGLKTNGLPIFEILTHKTIAELTGL